MSDKIKIDTVNGGNAKDQRILKGCYFLPTGNPGDYQMYDRDNDLIVTDPALLTSGTGFMFTLDSIDWTISDFFITSTSKSGHARGAWTNSAQVDADEGTFTAQAGGGAEEETASSAYA